MLDLEPRSVRRCPDGGGPADRGNAQPGPTHLRGCDPPRRHADVCHGDELLDYARGTPRLDPRLVLIAEIVAALDGRILHRLARDDFQVVRDLRTDGPCRVDRKRVTRVLVNLIKNASEAIGGV